MVQATVGKDDDRELAGALYAVVLRLSRLPVDEPVDKAGLAVLHEARRLGSITGRGADVLTRVLGHRAATIREAIAHWPDSDRSALHKLLRRLGDDLSKVTELCPPADAGQAERTQS